MKKFELHLDALITIILIIVLAVSFIFYQRYQYNDLLKAHGSLLWEKSDLNAEIAYFKTLHKKCLTKAEKIDTEPTSQADNLEIADEKSTNSPANSE